MYNVYFTTYKITTLKKVTMLNRYHITKLQHHILYNYRRP